MKFNSISFLLFFLLVYSVYWNSRQSSKVLILFVASLLFYSAWSVYFAIHFLLVIIINYLALKVLLSDSPQKNRSNTVFYAIIAFNLLNLFLFKYFYLFLQTLFLVTGNAVFEKSVINNFLLNISGTGSIILPLAISFYTFQIVAFQVDCRRGMVKELPAFMEFSVFILFFPQLVAGPIVRHSEFFYQLKNIVSSEKMILVGSLLVVMGLMKKILIADTIAPYVAQAYHNPSLYSWQGIALAVTGYTVQIYADFSGYTDIARGLGKMLGIELPENFKGPYLSRSMTEFWSRWHVTLGSWMRDYIYIPLGGSRLTFQRNLFNLFITFVVSGIWHGANYTFIVWGSVHGLFIIIEKFTEKILKSKKLWTGLSFYSSAGIAYTFFVFWFGMIFFNSPDISSAWVMLERMGQLASGMNFEKSEMVLGMFVFILILNLVQYKNFQENLFLKSGWSGLFVFAFIIFVLIGKYSSGGKTFIYFQF